MISKFIHASEGLIFLFCHDKNFRLQFLLGTICIITGFLLKISNTEWLIVFAFIALVISLEMVNSCIERMCDFIQPDYHIEIKNIKDGSAAAVLVVSIFSLIAALIIFLPKIIHYVLPYLSSIYFS
jgi:diacylglycerol kinase